jgi:thiamine pyrophosphokinase
MKPSKRFTKKKMTSSPRLKSWADTTTKASPRTVSTVSKRALVICNGEAPSRKLAQQLARNVDVIVAADGGANVVRELGIRPQFIIGDLDSITTTTRRFFSPSTFIRVSRQDNTDFEKALALLLELKITRATIIAATGERLDHTLGNLSVIWNYTKDIEIEIVGDGFVALPIMKKKTIAAKKGTTVSLAPFGVCSGITLKGLFYALTNATMKVGEIGVSNVVAKSPFTVEVKKGKMLMIVLADYAGVKTLV